MILSSLSSEFSNDRRSHALFAMNFQRCSMNFQNVYVHTFDDDTISVISESDYINDYASELKFKIF